MQKEQGQEEDARRLSGRERGALSEFLVYIEERVRETDPVCAHLVRMARLALDETDGACGPTDRSLH